MIGEVIKAFREKHKMSLREFAKRQNISAATAYRIESGKPMDQRTMSRLIAWLFEPNTPPKKGSAGLQPTTTQGKKCLCFHGTIENMSFAGINKDCPLHGKSYAVLGGTSAVA